MPEIRLSKAAKELSVATSTIVDFLHSKGIKIETIQGPTIVGKIELEEKPAKKGKVSKKEEEKVIEKEKEKEKVTTSKTKKKTVEETEEVKPEPKKVIEEKKTEKPPVAEEP